MTIVAVQRQIHRRTSSKLRLCHDPDRQRYIFFFKLFIQSGDLFVEVFADAGAAGKKEADKKRFLATELSRIEFLTVLIRHLETVNVMKMVPWNVNDDCSRWIVGAGFGRSAGASRYAERRGGSSQSGDHCHGKEQARKESEDSQQQQVWSTLLRRFF